MRWAMRGLEACVPLPPSENHLRGDFKNIPVMFQDKSLITGNYGLPISPPLPPYPFCKSSLPHPHYFYPLIQQEKQPGRGKQEWSRGGRGWGYYLGADSDHVRWRFTALPFMWSGSLVGSNYQPNDPNWALWWSSWTGWVTIAALLLCIVLYAFKQSRVSVCACTKYVFTYIGPGLGLDLHSESDFFFFSQ